MSQLQAKPNEVAWYIEFLKVKQDRYDAKHMTDGSKPKSAEEEQFAASKASLDRRKTTVATLKAKATEQLGNNLPAEMTDKFAAAEKLLAVKDETNPTEIGEAISASDGVLEEAETALDRLASEKARWLSSLGPFEGRFAALQGHAQKAAPAVQARTEDVRQKLEKAKLLADTHKYGDAINDLTPLTDECAKAEKLADDCAHYNAILKDREDRVAALANPSGYADVTNLIDATKKKLANAKALAEGASPDFTKAVEGLMPLAKECIDVARISDRAAAYQKKRDDVKGYVTELENQTAVQEVATWLTPLKALHEDSDYAKTKDYVMSLTLLDRAASMKAAVNRATKASKDFAAQYQMASDCIDILELQEGKDAIQQEIERLKGDLLFADGKKAAGEFVTAKNVCAKIVDAMPALEERAKKCADYLAKKEEVAKKKKEWASAPAEAVAQLSAQVAKFEGLATGKAAAKDYEGAIAQLDEAMLYAEKALKKFKSAARSITPAIADKVLFDGLYQGADTQYKNLPVAEVSAELRDEWKAIEQELLQAQNSSGTDLSAAHGHLATAKEGLVKAALKAKDYKAYAELLKGDIKTLMDKLDTPDGLAALDTEVAKFKADVSKAATLAAQTKVDEALETLRKAKKDGDVLESMLGEYLAAREEEKRYVTDNLRKVSLPRVADLKVEVEKMQERLAEMFRERQFKQAEKFAFSIYLVLEKAGNIISDHMKFAPERTKARKSIDDLKDVTCDAIVDDIKAAEKALEKADAEADARNHKNAQQIIEKILEDCKEPLRIGKEYQDYAPSLKAAKEAIADLSKAFPQVHSVALRVRELNARLAGAEGLAAKKEFDKAKQETDDLLEAVLAANEIGTKQRGLDRLQSEPDLKKKLAAVMDQYKKLKAHGGIVAASNEVKAVEEALKALKALLTATEKKPDDVKAALAKAAANVAKGNEVADQWAHMDAKLKAAIARAATLRSTYAEPPSVLRRLDEIDKVLALGRAGVDRAEFVNAMSQLQGAESDMSAAEAVAKAHKAYVEEKAKVLPTVEKLAGHAHRYAVSKELGEAQAQLVKAAEQAGAEKHAEAMAALAEAARICDSAGIQADMHESKEVPEDKIKALLAKKDGAKELDKIIATLDPQTQRKACQKALELRFDMQLKQYTDMTTEDTADNVPAPNVMRLYKLMKDLPDAHTADNPSVKLVKQFDVTGGDSQFSKFTKEIDLYVGRATEKLEDEIGQEWQLGNIDAKCKPADGPPPKKFNWTTLHEIGHAVDDKLGYMAKQGAGQAGWMVHGADVGKIAEKAAEEFDYNKGYIESYLANPKGKVLIPAPKDGVDQPEWDRRRIAAETWCDSIRADRSIYYSASDTARLKLKDGRVYQEADPGKWVSYDFTARSQGVTGYQFKAAGEWFAELYAAYHTDKMNPNHPARAWLEPLNKKD